ncbi:transcriptional regulator [Paraburkholderia sediminicola]|uniref:transcriptional regulator n=1 Tax=Paraburkholderia sediminicola TaxID=458836 RepID=UPI0038BA2908
MTTRDDSIRRALTDFPSLPDIARVRLPLVAALYACAPRTVHRRVEAGVIPKPEKRGGVLMWRVGDLRRDLGA